MRVLYGNKQTLYHVGWYFHVSRRGWKITFFSLPVFLNQLLLLSTKIKIKLAESQNWIVRWLLQLSFQLIWDFSIFFKMSHIMYIPIDAKFDADFKNIYFYMFILSRSPFLSPVASNVQKRWFFVYISWTTQDKRIKVFIVEISVKFRVDWYATWGVFKKLNFFVFSRMLVHKWRMRIFVFDPPDGGWHFFIKLDHLTKFEGGPALIWQKWPYCFHPTYI